MFLGTPKWMWGVIVVLLVVGLAGIGTGRMLIGLLVLGAGFLLFATSPSGPKRERRNWREDPTPAPPLATTSTTKPPPVPTATPPRRHLDIEGSDPTQV